MDIDEIVLEFIPGGLIGKIKEKIRPSSEDKSSSTIEEEDAPKVVNGYLQTSNTKVIRPEFSNPAALRKAAENAKKVDADS